MDSKSKAGAQVIQGARRFTKSRLSSPSPDSSDDDTIPPFEAVSKNLVVIGALTIGRYLRAPVETDDFDIPHHIRDTREKSAPPPPTLPVPTSSEPKEVKSDAQSKMQCVAQLHHTCQRVFGKTDLLKFEFIEVDGPNSEFRSRPLSPIPCLSILSKTMHPHDHSSKWRQALIYNSCGLFTQERGEITDSFSRCRDGSDRLYYHW